MIDFTITQETSRSLTDAVLLFTGTITVSSPDVTSPDVSSLVFEVTTKLTGSEVTVSVEAPDAALTTHCFYHSCRNYKVLNRFK